MIKGNRNENEIETKKIVLKYFSNLISTYLKIIIFFRYEDKVHLNVEIKNRLNAMAFL